LFTLHKAGGTNQIGPPGKGREKCDGGDGEGPADSDKGEPEQILPKPRPLVGERDPML